MPIWQLALIAAVQLIGWYLAALITDMRAIERETRRTALDQQLNEALRDLFEQRERQTKEQ
ncbi:hypothetical protein ACFYQA_08415 [Streptomyces sp. NPDC005774]|uniref:hypothetical protein n=1 Tax=Streptomyces sp. NPDC005774 TaxID=3364728 RepID=UPI003686C06A